MELSVGWLIIGISLAGFIGCLAGLLVSGRVFRKQREHLLEQIERK